MSSRHERGHVLIWALVLLAVAAAVGANVLTRHRTLVQETKVDGARVHDLHAAEAGIERCRVELAQAAAFRGAAWTVGTREVVVAVQNSGAGWRVTSRSGSVRLVATLVPGTKLPLITSWRE